MQTLKLVLVYLGLIPQRVKGKAMVRGKEKGRGRVNVVIPGAFRTQHLYLHTTVKLKMK